MWSDQNFTPILLIFHILCWTVPSSYSLSTNNASSINSTGFLGSNCAQNSDCLPDLSECHATQKVCTCKAYSVEASGTTCLPGTLLGFQCEADAQCAVKVPSSGCVNGICACGQGYVAYRRHTCLSPAKLGDVCFENEQCTLADGGSYCKYVVPKVYGRCQCQSGRELNGKNKCSSNLGTQIGQICQEDNDCVMANAFCQRKLDGSSVCTCDIAFTPSSDRRRCLPTYRGLLSATSLGYPCHAHLECQLADPNSICSGGICDCGHGNGTFCSAKHTGCHKQTFQCRSDGKCISWHFLCDGKPDCADASDEACDLAEGECPPQTFQCGGPGFGGGELMTYDQNLSPSASSKYTSIQCISKSKRCNGIQDCPDSSDEEGCAPADDEGCPPGTFQCAKTKGCLPEQQFCNAVADCPDISDEDDLKCRTEFQPADFCPYRCKNGLCRSSAILCSGVDGCGDNGDEEQCSVCRCPRRIT